METLVDMLTSSKVTVNDWTPSTPYGPDLGRRNLLYPRFATSSAACDEIVGTERKYMSL